jgi:hypothetical protein
MKTKRTLAASIAAVGLTLAAGATIAHQTAPVRGAAPSTSGAQHDHGTYGAPAGNAAHAGMRTSPAAAVQSDPAARADLDLVHTMVHGHASISRTVTDLPDGIRTLTESSDPTVAAALMAHVGSMMQRLESGHVFNLFSSTIPVLFANRERIVTRFEMTPRGAMVVQTSTDPVVAAALQAHAREVSELATEGPVAMRRNMQRAMTSGDSTTAMRTGAGMGTGTGQHMRQGGGMGMGMDHGRGAGSHAGHEGRSHGY